MTYCEIFLILPVKYRGNLPQLFLTSRLKVKDVNCVFKAERRLAVNAFHNELRYSRTYIVFNQNVLIQEQ